MTSSLKHKKFNKRAKELSREDQFGIRLILGLIFVLILSVFLHFREVRIEMLEIDSYAKVYVVAQVDFEFPDADTTLVLRQEAIRDVGKIYRISEPEINKTRHKFENYLIHHPNWRKGQETITFEEVYNALEAVVEILTAAHLTDARTYKKRLESHLPLENYYVTSALDGENLTLLPDSFWNSVETSAISNFNFNKETIIFIIDYFKGSKWKLVNDIDAQRMFKQVIEASIPEKYTKVKAGSRIIDQGEKVSPKHIAMLSAMKQEIRESRNLWTLQTILGSLVFSIIITISASFYFYKRQKEFFESIRQLSLFLSIIVITLLFAKIGEWLLLSSSTKWGDFVRYPIVVPLASILICILLNEEISLFTTFYLTIVMGFTLAVDHGYFLLTNLVTGTFAVIVSMHLKKRKEVFLVSTKIWLVAAFIIFAFNLVNNSLLSSTILIDFISSLVNLVIIAILLIGLMPILESLFNVMTDMTLMEYMDPTNTILKRLSIEAPGTYQHSLSIGHIAEYVANSIGANGLFCRVITLYHDIGKLTSPHYYTENQMLMSGKPFNIHNLLTPIESAYIIKSHITDGVSLARQNKLPEAFIDIIQQHHGTTLIKYFYAKQLEEMKGVVADVNQNAFRYSGPKPQTKEAAIIMLADSLEAASRSLDDNSEEAIKKMVNRIVSDKVNDDQFDECPLTFKELTAARDKFVEILKATHHLRIKYPDLK